MRGNQQFAEIAASNALGREQALREALSGRRAEAEWSLDEMRSLARRYRVARLATPPEKAINRSGRTYVQLVLEALDANRITSVDAARYLDLKFEHFGKLRDFMSQSPWREA